MTDGTLSKEHNGHVLILSLTPLDKNAQQIGRLSQDLADVCREIDEDETIRVVVLTGWDQAGPWNHEGRPVIPDHAETNHFSPAGPVAAVDKPIIAAINGNAFGQGLELALACDIRIGAENSRFGLSHTKYGFIPWDGGTQRLARLVGKSKALEMLLTGESIDDKEAFRIGLVNQIAPLDSVMKDALDMGKKMAEKGPIALRYAKEAVCKGSELTLEHGLRLEADLYYLLHTTSDRERGINAFREKKSPLFNGN